MPNYFLAVAGNIGVGKSTLTRRLADRLEWEPVFEAVDENPYLDDFYGDMTRWSFNSQVFFLSRRLREHYLLLQRDASVIQDRSVYEDAEIFARNLYDRGVMSARDWQTYTDLYRTLGTLLRAPNLVVYLRASTATLLRRIGQRGRQSERSISEDYLAALNALYDEWAANFRLCPVLTIETDGLNYVENDDHLAQIVDKIQHRLYGRDTLTLMPGDDL
jgi:deoxyadenosine/deoxycytidine kinase